MSDPQESLVGMSLNERLYSRGLFEQFDTAKAGKNSDELRAILTQLDVDDVDWVLDQLLEQKPEADF